MRLYILLGVALVCLSFGWHYRHVIAQNKILKTAYNSVKSYVGAQEIIIDQNREIEESEHNEIEKIHRAPPQDDGPIAPIMRDTLRRGL